MNKKNWNDNWKFTKSEIKTPVAISNLEGEWEELNIPHTWNNIDGQDGGNDYYRGACYYIKELKKSDLPDAKKVYIELEGANSSAKVFVNGKEAGSHHGGYSTWRVNITEFLEEENLIAIEVDNSKNDFVYPQMADFTFYGGIYRDISIICVGEKHFDLDYFGGPAVKVTPEIKGKDALVEVEVFLTNVGISEKLVYTIMEGEKVVEQKTVFGDETKVNLEIENVHLWNGRKDPFLYTAKVELYSQDEKVDERVTKFGCRTFEVCPEKGFFLNGESYPLRGVSRHQDFKGIGNALTKEHHKNDMDLIYEVGATTIRLAHYQHDQYFYDLCDEYGMVVWAEIPYISRHMPNGKENTISQMNELVIQNYNHPSIVVWGLSNEISMRGADDPSLLDNHHTLNDLCHELDKTRLTVGAVVSPCGMDEEYVHISDVVSYNHYYGWYGGDTSMNGPWFDNFHEKYPNKAVGISEYGCEALDWHTSNPEQGDYTEEYQAYYHEELIKQLYTRPYIWATHVWNMFDFAADARAEGGVLGMNNKGLVNFDRTYKKDSFYAYKAWLSDEPFVHICGKRYIDRVEDITKVTVYSNQPEVEMFVNGESIGKQTSDVHFFYFDVLNVGETKIEVKAGECTDSSNIKKVLEPNEDYIMKEVGDVLNWFEIDTPDGYFSINDKIGDLFENAEGKKAFQELMVSLLPEEMLGQMAMAQDDGVASMMDSFTVKRFINLIGAMATRKPEKEELLELNKKLNQIKK